MILDLVIEDGNPADTDRFQPMLDRHIEHYGKAPRQSAADGGYASTANLAQAKALGVRDVAFHKKRGLAIEDMVKSRWVYRKLRNFRAGIEANISCLKRAYGLSAAPGKAWITSAYGSVAYNLALFAHLQAPSSTDGAECRPPGTPGRNDPINRATPHQVQECCLYEPEPPGRRPRPALCAQGSKRRSFYGLLLGVLP